MVLYYNNGVPTTVIQNIDTKRLSEYDPIEHELNRQNTEGIKPSSITSFKTVLLCRTCYWCASLIGAKRRIGSCPICSTLVTVQIPEGEFQ